MGSRQIRILAEVAFWICLTWGIYNLQAMIETTNARLDMGLAAMQAIEMYTGFILAGFCYWVKPRKEENETN